MNRWSPMTYPPHPRVLLVTDEDPIRSQIQDHLTALDIQVETAAGASEAMLRLQAGPYGMLITELHLEERYYGLRLMTLARSLDPQIRCIGLTASASEPLGLTPGGGDAIIETPVQGDYLRDAVTRALSLER